MSSLPFEKTTPVIEAPATSNLAWLNRTVFVGKGRFEISSDGLAVGESQLDYQIHLSSCCC